eukprot:449765-Amorphochlora_amoeboformis.AAC.1
MAVPHVRGKEISCPTTLSNPCLARDWPGFPLSPLAHNPVFPGIPSEDGFPEIPLGRISHVMGVRSVTYHRDTPS